MRDRIALRNYVGSISTIGIFPYVAQAVERVLEAAFGNKLRWFESHYRHISLYSQSNLTRASSSLQNIDHSQRKDFHAPGRIETHNLSRRGAVYRPSTGTGEVSHLLIENENSYFSP